MKHLLVSGIALLLAINSQAQIKPGKYMGEPLQGAERKSISVYETALRDPLNARIYTLSNGMKVYLSVYKNAPRVQTYIAVKAGSKNDPSNATGLAHYLEHMLFKGSDVFGTNDFKKESAEIEKIEALFELYRNTRDENKRKNIYHQIDSISVLASKYAIANEYDKMLAAIGADGTNAFTSFDETVYVNDIPSNQITNWLKIEAERFRRPVLRLFHTELEAVYEEKNRGLDNDDAKVWEALFAGLFKNHTYGTQTTIGTIEHLKNPSMVEIRKYYEKYYVPNNMAIIMSGDFDPDKIITEIEQNFGSQPSKPVETYTATPELPITQKVVKNVLGPNPANVSLAWRFGADGTRDADICTLLAGMLYNNSAGLMDINLNQAQKVLNSSNFFYPLKDYSFFAFSGEPREGQSLEEVEQLILSQIELLKKGDFADWLMQAVITDLKLKKTKELENNSTRADAMLTAFVHGINWQDHVDLLERLSKISKQEIVDFVNKHFNANNYAVAYKRTGEDNTIVKVEKPQINPVEVNREITSQFVEQIINAPVNPIEPQFLDYEKDIKRLQVKSRIPLLYNKNVENELFELYYKFDMGGNHNKKLAVAVKCIPYLSTEGMNAAELRQEMYKLGCTFRVFSDNENTWISLSGLNDNFEKALQLFERILAKPVLDEEVQKNLIADIIKERNDNKLQKRLILNRGLINYARFGPLNPFTYVLTEGELLKLTNKELRNIISSLNTFEHKILYYGPTEPEVLNNTLNAMHKVPAKLKALPKPMEFPEKQMSNTVYVVDYDMKQVELIMLSNGEAYNAAKVPVITLYNNYFGGGMSGVLFQDLRESKALAYSTFSRYNQPNKLNKKYYNFSYIGSQADKLAEATSGLIALLNSMPKAESSFQAAKEMILQEMRTQRITRAEIIFNYLEAQNLGNKTDIRKDIFNQVKNYAFDDIESFHQAYIKGKPLSLLVLGKKDGLDVKTLEKYGPVKFLSLQDVFGY